MLTIHLKAIVRYAKSTLPLRYIVAGQEIVILGLISISSETGKKYNVLLHRKYKPHPKSLNTKNVCLALLYIVALT